VNSNERYKRRLSKKNCGICGTPFTGTDKQKNCLNHRYHKKESDLVKQRIFKKCPICGKEFYGRNKNCSKGCYDIYIEKLKRGRLKKCSYCGRHILTRPCHERKYNFCSKDCWFKFKKNKPNFKIRKDKHPQWKGGIKRRSTTTIRYKQWRESVYQRDNYKCVFCGNNRLITAHHIVAWSDDEQLRFYKTNGITLCKKCHKEIHANNFSKRLNYENTKNQCSSKGIRLRKKISNRIEELIWQQHHRNIKKQE
jgi:hypothetical protein